MGEHLKSENENCSKNSVRTSCRTQCVSVGKVSRCCYIDKQFRFMGSVVGMQKYTLRTKSEVLSVDDAVQTRT
jgi:hypothetical protein